ncbi:MAG: hypothetical protein B2I17_01990 [Thermoplasmatales archaeon B_DKE]|nr:MAG: hypothetical protein B2I17_01990 [Thermoplasmatales archaeon B_DKE]
MDNFRPLISVILVAHDRKKFIIQAAKSTINQTLDRTKYEVIVVKNYHDLEIDTLLESLGCFNIYTESIEVGNKMSIGILHAKGEIITFLEDDDLYEPSKLETLLKYFSQDPRICFLHNSLSSINEKGDLIAHHTFKSVLIEFMPSSIFIKTCARAGIKYSDLVYTSCMAVRKKTVLPHISALKEIQAAPDMFLVLSFLASGCKGLHIPEKLSQYRLHESLSIRSGKFSKFVSGNTDIRKRWTEDYTVMANEFHEGQSYELANILLKYNLLLSLNLKLNRDPRKKLPLLLNFIKNLNGFLWWDHWDLVAMTFGTLISPQIVVRFYRLYWYTKYQSA